MKVIYPWDTSPFVKVSLRQVVETLFEAMILVFLVMYLFLQNIRATFIPAIAIPVVLLGTLAVMSVAGFSCQQVESPCRTSCPTFRKAIPTTRSSA